LEREFVCTRSGQAARAASHQLARLTARRRFACSRVGPYEIGAVEWAGKAGDQRYPAIVSIAMREFEPRLRRSAAWPALPKKVNLA